MKERFIFIGIGTALMLLISLLLQKKRYELPWWKAIVLPFILTICGVTGTMLLYFVETGRFGGISFYGSVLLIPVLLFPIGKLLKIPYGKITDCAVPQIFIMLAVMKVHCFVSGCCGGICLFTAENGVDVHFPSQIVEVVIALAITAVALYMSHEHMFDDRLYAVFFIVYGSLRFVLNFFRDGIKPFLWFIPAGHLWSIVSIGIGISWLWIWKKLESKKDADKIEEPSHNV